MISLHSHSGQFCRHAKGSLEETVEEAVRQGFRTYGLSEHIPRYERAHLYPEEEDMQLGDLEDAFDAYIIEATHLKSKYAGQIELLIGLETEYIDSAGLDRLQLLLDKHAGSISYLVGSVHHVNSIPIDFDRSTFDKAMASFPESSPEGLARLDQLFCAYFDAQYEVLQRFRPEVIGHFDLCRLYLPEARFSNPTVWSRITRNVEFAISYGALFEVNAAAFRKDWKSAYPGPDIVALIKASKGHFTLSDDSHGPSAVGLHYTDAHRYLVEQSIQNLGYLTMEDDRELSGSGGAERNEDGGGRSGGRTATWAPRGSREEGKARNRTRVVFLKEGWQTDQFWAARR